MEVTALLWHRKRLTDTPIYETCENMATAVLRDPAIQPDSYLSERRIIKLKTMFKNSRRFRSDLGVDAFMDVHSIVETTKKVEALPTTPSSPFSKRRAPQSVC